MNNDKQKPPGGKTAAPPSSLPPAKTPPPPPEPGQPAPLFRKIDWLTFLITFAAVGLDKLTVRTNIRTAPKTVFQHSS